MPKCLGYLTPDSEISVHNVPTIVIQQAGNVQVQESESTKNHSLNGNKTIDSRSTVVIILLYRKGISVFSHKILFTLPDLRNELLIFA
jgi:hypothetical protein